MNEDVSKLLAEIKEEINEMNNDNTVKQDPYSSGMLDELKWIYFKLSAIIERSR